MKISKEKVCRQLGITRMGLYKKEVREVEQLKQAEVVISLVSKIKEEQPCLSVRKIQGMIQGDLDKNGIKIGRDGLLDLLREFNMLVKRKRYKHYSTDSNHSFKKYPNQIKDIKPTEPNRVWVSDITYIEGSKGFSYLSLITDAYSRKIVGHYLSDSYSVKGTIEALKKALKDNKVQSGLIHHSDRGVQYCSKEYTSILKRKKAVISMTETSSPYENAMAERVNGILKTELLQPRYKDWQNAKQAVNKAVEIYNNKRPHLSIEMMTPQKAHLQKGELRTLWKKKVRQP
jgi:transposase InsO family protein